MKKDQTDFHILKSIEADSSVSQRKLSSQMDLNVASVNFALKALVKKGFVTMLGENPRRTKYFVTPTGLKEKTNLAYKFFGSNINFYKEIRSDMEARIERAIGGIDTDIAVYGSNELAEIAYIVVSKMNCTFQGFFLEKSKVRGEKILGYDVQDIRLLKGERQCLLLLTEEFPSDSLIGMDTKNIGTMSLLDYVRVT